MTPHERYREKNRERLAAMSKRWRTNNREKYLAGHRAHREKPGYKEQEKVRTTNSRRTNPFKFSVQQARHRARTNGWAFDLDVDYLTSLWTGRCPILNVPLTLGAKAGTVTELNQASLDRLDCSKGYIKGNVQYISFRANNIKTDATFEEFEQIYNWWKDRRND